MFLVIISAWKINAKLLWRYPDLTELVVAEHYAEDLGALLLGSRRLAADLAYIQFLQYYGTPSQGGQEEENEPPHHHPHFDGGNYPRVKEMGTRLLRLDPFFHP